MKLTCPSCGTRLEVSVDPSEAGVRPVECASCHALLQWSLRPELEQISRDAVGEDSVPTDVEPLLSHPPKPPVEAQEDIQLADDDESQKDAAEDDETLYDAPIPQEVLLEAEPIHMVDEEMILPSSENNSSPSGASVSPWVTSMMLIGIGFGAGVIWSELNRETGTPQPAVVQVKTASDASDPPQKPMASGEEKSQEETGRSEETQVKGASESPNSAESGGGDDASPEPVEEGEDAVASQGGVPDAISDAEASKPEDVIEEIDVAASPDVSSKGDVLVSDALIGGVKERGDGIVSETDASAVDGAATPSTPEKESKPKTEKRVETVKSYDSWMKEGNTHYRMGSTVDLKKAVLAFQEASKRTSSVEPLSKLGACHSKLGNHEAAFQSFKEAIGTNPNYRAAQIGLARAYKRAGRLNKARTAYDTYLTRFPDGNHRQEALKALASLKK